MPFYGKNKEKSSVTIAAQRSSYKTEAFTQEQGRDPVEVSDFTFAEFVNYGRIDTRMNTVILKRDSLSFIESNSEGNPIALLNFVSQAAKDVIADFDRARLLAKIPTSDPLLSKIELIKGYTDPEDAYYRYLNNLLEEFITFTFNTSGHQAIMDFKSFIERFFSYYKQITPTIPLTYTSWQRSKQSSIFTSGLAFSIADFPIDEDIHKAKFTLNPIFPYYKNICLKRGFYMAKNSPWVLVANLGSSQMKQYYGKQYLTNPTGVFTKHYRETFSFDIEYMRNAMIRSYNGFVERKPYEKIVKYCPNNKLKPEIQIREPVSLQSVASRFSNSYFISLYGEIRNIEEGKPFTPAALKKIINYTKRTEKTLDMDRAIDYINEEFRITYRNKHGGIHWYQDLLAKRRQPK